MNENILIDEKLKCLSIIKNMQVSAYLDLAEKAYKDKGGISGQRMPLKTKTAQIIRKRMVHDISNGAILPPIVIGIIVYEDVFNKLQTGKCLIENVETKTVSIIDGMQRTTAIKEALEINPDLKDSLVRVEYWVSHSMNSLIYRMLVLNTGQVPWDIKRQLDTIYEPIINELRESLPELDLRLLDEPKRRSSPGQYQSSKLIEYFLCFTTRKVDVDLKDKIAEDFARMDTLSSTSKDGSLKSFIIVLERMLHIDEVISRAKNISDNGRFKSGKDLFTSVPVGAGFISASAVHIYGPSGLDNSEIEIKENTEKYIVLMDKFLSKIKTFNDQQLQDFLEFDLLNEKLSVKSSKVGTFERDFFFRAFESLIKYSERLTNLQVCWSAK